MPGKGAAPGHQWLEGLQQQLSLACRLERPKGLGSQRMLLLCYHSCPIIRKPGHQWESKLDSHTHTVETVRSWSRGEQQKLGEEVLEAGRRLECCLLALSGRTGPELDILPQQLYFISY